MAIAAVTAEAAAVIAGAVIAGVLVAAGGIAVAGLAARTVDAPAAWDLWIAARAGRRRESSLETAGHRSGVLIGRATAAATEGGIANPGVGRKGLGWAARAARAALALFLATPSAAVAVLAFPVGKIAVGVLGIPPSIVCAVEGAEIEGAGVTGAVKPARTAAVS